MEGEIPLRTYFFHSPPSILHSFLGVCSTLNGRNVEAAVSRQETCFLLTHCLFEVCGCVCEDVFFSERGPNISMIGAHDSFDLVLAFGGGCVWGGFFGTKMQILVGGKTTTAKYIIITEDKVCCKHNLF